MVHYIDKSLYSKNKKGLGNENHGNYAKERPKRGFFATKCIEFCNRTDLHGYKYIFMEDLNVFERVCWALAVVISTAFATFFVVTAYNWYARNPIVTVIESTQGAIWDIPFPAVTICNLNVISKKAARQFADTITLPVNVTADSVFEALRFAPLLHSTFAANPAQKAMLHTLQTVLELNSLSIETLFKTMSPAASCNDLVQRCMWKNTIYRCESLFQQVYTYFAVCCSFNYYAIDSSRSKKTEGGLEQMDTPRRVASCGYQTALTVLIDTKPDDYYSTAVASQGALLFIDNAYNIADLDSPVRLVNPSSEVLIAMSPERTYTTPGIRAFHPLDRQCYYNDEIEIGSFRQYSFHNCMSYQRVEAVKNTCDCVPFYFPIRDYHRVCNFNDLDCLQSFLGQTQNKTPNNHDKAPNCLPECEHYDYPLEVALGKLAKNIRLDGLPFFNDVNLENRSLVNVFFNDLVSTRYRRDVYLNWQNLLASFGGLLSLMLGFTLISGFDLILFFTYNMAYGSLTYKNTNEIKQKGYNYKNNTIHVQEFNKKNTHITKKYGDKEAGKWHTEDQYGVNNRY